MRHYHDSEDLKALGEFKKLAPAEFQGFVELDAIVPIQIDSRPMSSARRPKSRIIWDVAWGDMNVEKTPIFMLALLVSMKRLARLVWRPGNWRGVLR
jgi:hypothetical protein